MYNPDPYRLENNKVCRDRQTAFLPRLKPGVSCLFHYEPLSDEAIREIEESLEGIKAGRLYTLEEARVWLQAIWHTE